MKKHAPAFLALVTAAKKLIQETDVETVSKRIAAGDKSFYLVDAREDSEWQKAYLPGAIHLGKGIIERDIEKEIPDKKTEIILYCGGGFRSALAAQNLQQMGYENVLSMDGGFRDWCDAGLELAF